jgi:imidazolonepropionase-like amidohydrolase
MFGRIHVFIALSLFCAGYAVAQDAPPPPQVLFKNVNIFNGTEDKLYENHQVLVEGNLIRAISAGEIETRAGATVIDGGGRTLMPGIIDSHTHMNVMEPGGLKEWEASTWERIGALAAATAQDMFYEGFTTIRDMGGMSSGLQKTIDQGLIDGPRIYPSGAYISQTSGHGDLTLPSQQINPENSNVVKLGITNIVDGEDEVRKAARRNFAGGASQIKIMMGGGISSEKGPLFAPQFTDDEVRAIVEEAEARESYVATHIYQPHHIIRALNLGVKSIEHGQFIDEEGMKLLVKKEAFIAPFTAALSGDELAKHPVYGKPGSPQNQKSLEFIKESKNFAGLVNKYKPNLVFAGDVVFLPGENARRQRDFEKYYFTKLFGNFEALKGMTSTPGKLAQMTGGSNPYPHKLGVIENNAYADILIVDGNPLEDITAIGAVSVLFDAPARSKHIESIMLIMKDGKIYKNTL